jgi:hypothetical protein
VGIDCGLDEQALFVATQPGQLVGWLVVKGEGYGPFRVRYRVESSRAIDTPVRMRPMGRGDRAESRSIMLPLVGEGGYVSLHGGQQLVQRLSGIG